MHNKPIIDEIKDILPGFLVSLTIGMVSNVIANFIPSLGSATIAILFGIIVGNLFLSHDIFQRGYKFSESNLLAYSIVLLGGTLSLSSLMEIKLTGIIYIITQMAITIMVCMFVGKRLQFSSDFIYLMASGNSVCGSSAIAATSSTINASDNDKGITITITNVMGIFLMFLLPIISRLLYNNELLKTSALIGGVIQSVGQVIASGLMINEQVKEFAMIFKIFRVILLILVVFLFGHLKNKSNKEIIQDEESNIKSGNVTVPWYVIGIYGDVNKGLWDKVKEDRTLMELENYSQDGISLGLCFGYDEEDNNKYLVAVKKPEKYYGNDTFSRDYKVEIWIPIIKD
ncbi:MAG: putative sulfate exporter family transporter [Clostridiales bacterium]|nr:putative sulfate exporter family transporter [Clostridiales bacterium]